MKITLIGVLVFLAIVVGFFWWFGGPPVLEGDSSMTERGLARSWVYCALLFVGGAGTACFGEKEYGMFPPTSLRWLFIVFGAIIMGISAAWMHSLKVARPEGTGAFAPPARAIVQRGRGAGEGVPGGVMRSSWRDFAGLR